MICNFGIAPSIFSQLFALALKNLAYEFKFSNIFIYYIMSDYIVHRGDFIEINSSTVVKVSSFCYINELLEKVITEKVIMHLCF